MKKLKNTVQRRDRSIMQGNTVDQNIPKKTVEIRGSKEYKVIEVPRFDRKGKVIRIQRKEKHKKTVILISVSTAILVLVYAPQFIPEKNTGTVTGEILVETDREAIRSSNSILREYSMEDFDGDGVLNTDETASGTDPWRIDTDNDGVTDYAELHITNTSPTEWTSVLQDVQMKMDKTEEKSLANPYYIGNVILWPDSYEAKAYGSVVETMDGGYRFCGFSGSVLFPDSNGKYAYRVENGVHTLLENDLTDNSWMVESDDTVVLSDKKLEELIRLRFFGLKFDLKKNFATTLLVILLPERGLISSRKITEMDLFEGENTTKINEIVKPEIQETDSTRLMSNMTTLDSLRTVINAIDQGKCVAVSLFSSNQGEYLGIIYGYSSEGNLLIADMDTQNEKGTITITEKAKRMLNEDGEIVSVLYYDWSAYGFSSENSDRISFFGLTNTMGRKGGFE